MNMERLKKLKWPSLELRRKRLGLVQLYKIMFGLCDIDKFKYLDIVGESRTRSRHTISDIEIWDTCIKKVFL